MVNAFNLTTLFGGRKNPMPHTPDISTIVVETAVNESVARGTSLMHGKNMLFVDMILEAPMLGDKNISRSGRTPGSNQFMNVHSFVVCVSFGFAALRCTLFILL